MPNQYALKDFAGVPTTGLTRRIVKTLLWPVEILKRRHDMNELASRSDHELKDMGLTRSDLMNASSQLYSADPTVILEGVREERRRNRMSEYGPEDMNWFRYTADPRKPGSGCK